MRLGTVIGRVTLSVRSKKYVGERLLLALPWKTQTFSDKGKFDPAIVVYDQLGAGVGEKIAISEGREAACPFPELTPVDAYCSALVDEIFYKDAQPVKP